MPVNLQTANASERDAMPKTKKPRKACKTTAKLCPLFEQRPEDDWYRIRFDGGCHRNGHPDASATWAYVVTDAFGTMVASDSGRVHSRIVSCNVAEWEALAEGLTRCAYVVEELLTKWAGIVIEGDSKIVVCAMAGKWKCKAPHLLERRNECLARLAEIGLPWHARWIPRHKNAECDAMAGRARKAVR